MTQIAITDVGSDAAVAIMSKGFKIQVSTFKLGSAAAYTPVASDTALHGTTVYEGTITEIIQTSDKQVTYKIVQCSTQIFSRSRQYSM
jgi:hypothetical protein